MKRIAVFSVLTILVLLAVLCGCTSTQPAQPVPVTTIAPTETPTPIPTPTPDPYPNATPLTKPVAFGAGTKTYDMAVTAYKIRPVFTWTDPSWNSPREQAGSQGSLEPQKGYNTKKPAEGNTFVFIYLSAAATGTEAAWAPSPNQVVVSYDGKTYPYTSLLSDQTIVDGETGTQYDFELGSGGTGGYVKTGKSNTVNGFLVYEIPASFVPEKTYVIVTPDTKTTGVWKLA